MVVFYEPEQIRKNTFDENLKRVDVAIDRDNRPMRKVIY